MLKGIDISNWQAGISPSALDIDFCICKATEGIGFTDKCCDGWITELKNAGKLWGFYHFARENNPEEEAQYFYDECEGYFGKGIPVLDYETENANNVEWCEKFIQKVYDLSGVWCVIYISAYRCQSYAHSWIPEKCGLWIAGYPRTITNWTDEEMPYGIHPWEFAAIWQFTSELIIDGCWSKLDGDIAYMSKEAWLKYADADESSTPEPAPVKNVDDLVREVLQGKHGTGEQRKNSLGSRYDEVQARINQLYDIADEVIDGKWGNGWNREQSLNGAGYPYDIVQGIVNEKLARI